MLSRTNVTLLSNRIDSSGDVHDVVVVVRTTLVQVCNLTLLNLVLQFFLSWIWASSNWLIVDSILGPIFTAYPKNCYNFKSGQK